MYSFGIIMSMQTASKYWPKYSSIVCTKELRCNNTRCQLWIFELPEPHPFRSFLTLQLLLCLLLFAVKHISHLHIDGDHRWQDDVLLTGMLRPKWVVLEGCVSLEAKQRKQLQGRNFVNHSTPANTFVVVKWRDQLHIYVVLLIPSLPQELSIWAHKQDKYYYWTLLRQLPMRGLGVHHREPTYWSYIEEKVCAGRK